MKFGTRWPPIPAGILIGISMLLAFIVAGRGIGASGAMTRLVAWIQHGLFPAATEQSAYFGKYFADGAHPPDPRRSRHGGVQGLVWRGCSRIERKLS